LYTLKYNTCEYSIDVKSVAGYKTTLKLPLSEFAARIFILATITPSPENSGQTTKITAGKRQAGAQS